ncbi:hypothetical protein ACVBEF_13560 [Glaciimonas sp. GG7]
MRVISTFLPTADWEEPENQVPLMAFDTLIDDKNVVVGLIVGKTIGPMVGKAYVTLRGLKIIRRVIEQQQLVHATAMPPVFAQMEDVDIARDQVRELLREAPHQSALVLVCGNDEIYEAVFPALCVNFQSPNTSMMQ